MSEDEIKKMKEEEDKKGLLKVETVVVPENPISVEEKLEKATKKTAGQRSKKGKAISFVFMLINIGIVAYLFISNISGLEPLHTVLGDSASLSYLFVGATGFLLLSILSETMRFSISMKNASKSFRTALSFKTVMLGKYYDYITPGSSGGMPFQIYHLYSRGVPGGAASGVPMSQFICNKMGFVLFAVVILILDIGHVAAVDNNPVIKTAIIIGMALNIFSIAVIMFASTNKGLTKRIIAWFLKLLHKMKIIKNYNKSLKSSLYTIYDYQANVKKLINKPLLLGANVILAGITYVMNAFIIFFIHAAFFGINWGLFGFILTSYFLIEFIMTYMPLPGGSGGAEWGFYALLLTLFGEGTIAWAVLFWRIYAYFSYLVVGLILVLYENLIGTPRYLKNKLQKTKLSSEGATGEGTVD